MPGPSDDRSDARRRGRQRRHGIDADRQAHAAQALAENLRGLDELHPCTPPLAIGVYVATDSEIDPAIAADTLRRSGHSILLPVVTGDRTMEFRQWRVGDELVLNRFGIPEPAETPLVDAAALDAVLVPCVAVDRQGWRLGFGAGFYDRAFAASELNVDSPLLIGVAHDVQLVDHLESGEWDVQMHMVVTDQRVLRIDPAHGQPSAE